MLSFDSQSHQYRWNEDPVPSVTQVIGTWIKINVYGVPYYCDTLTGTVISAQVFENAGDFGRAVHKMCELYIRGTLDTTTLPPILVSVLAQFQAWMQEYAPEIILTEKPLYSLRHKYAGTLDILCVTGKRLCLYDIKTGAHDMAGVQMAAYSQLLRDNLAEWWPDFVKISHGKGISSNIERYVLELPKDGGSYRVVPIKSSLRLDWEYFLSRLNQHKHLKEMKHGRG